MSGNATISTAPTPLQASNSLADLAARIRAEHEAVSIALKDSVRHAIAAGELLIEAKAQLKHGQWLPWLSEHCDLSERSTQVYMRLARNKANPQLSADLNIDAALQILAMPKDEPKPDTDTDEETTVEKWLPTRSGLARVGFLTVPGAIETFGVIEDEYHPGFYRLAHIEIFENADPTVDSGGCFTSTKRPVSSWGVKQSLQYCTRHPALFEQIEWCDVPPEQWPFPDARP